MPLVGTICCQDGKPKSFSHCMEQARGCSCEHPLPLLSAMADESTRREGIDISSSTLSSCPRQHVLKQRNDYYEDPDDYYARWMGSFSHHAIEHGGPWQGVIQETRMSRPLWIDGHRYDISGMPDWYDQTKQHIDDYKFVGWKPKELRPEHAAQVNVYAWILEGNGYPVETGRIIYLHQKARDTGKRKTIIDVPMWDEPKTQSYIHARLLPYEEYRNTGNMARMRVDPGDEWKGDFCPFRHTCNPGRCCVYKPPVDHIEAPVGDVDPGW